MYQQNHLACHQMWTNKLNFQYVDTQQIHLGTSLSHPITHPLSLSCTLIVYHDFHQLNLGSFTHASEHLLNRNVWSIVFFLDPSTALIREYEQWQGRKNASAVYHQQFLHAATDEMLAACCWHDHCGLQTFMFDQSSSNPRFNLQQIWGYSWFRTLWVSGSTLVFKRSRNLVETNWQWHFRTLA